MKVLTCEDARKLRIDAENILTWPATTDGDPLTYAHLRRFAKATVGLLNDLELIVENLANTDHERNCGAWNNYPEDCNCCFKEANEALRRLSGQL